jgi:hypothetical protein
MNPARSPARRRRHGVAAFGVCLMTALLVVTLPAADATTYKWVDKQGQVHYSDTPPQDVAYEVVSTPGRASAAPPPGAPLPTPEPQRPAPAPPATAAAESTAGGATDDGACVDALYQVALLNQQRPVFKLAADGSRRYLDDSDRPAELERLQRVRDANCAEEPGTRKSQEQRAGELMVALSRRCAEARDKLANYEDPATHTPDDMIERQRAFVAGYCRGGERTDLWIGDWIRVGR